MGHKARAAKREKGEEDLLWRYDSEFLS